MIFEPHSGLGMLSYRVSENGVFLFQAFLVIGFLALGVFVILRHFLRLSSDFQMHLGDGEGCPVACETDSEAVAVRRPPQPRLANLNSIVVVREDVVL